MVVEIQNEINCYLPIPIANSSLALPIPKRQPDIAAILYTFNSYFVFSTFVTCCFICLHGLLQPVPLSIDITFSKAANIMLCNLSMLPAGIKFAETSNKVFISRFKQGRFKMTVSTLKRLVSLAALAMTLGGFANQALALTFNLDTEFSGATAPVGTTPWLTATFDDALPSPSTVTLSMDIANLTAAEFVDEWLFNLNPALDPTALIFTYVSGIAASISTGVNFQQADGDGRFDIRFDFPNAPPSTRFGAGDAPSVYTISGIPTLTAASFDFSSVQGGGQGTFHSAAHIQAIGSDAEQSGWIGDSGGDGGDGGVNPIPEPGTILLFVQGLFGLAFYGRKRNG